MIADGLIKVLQKQKFNTFVWIIRIINIKKRLMAKKRIEALKDQLIA